MKPKSYFAKYLPVEGEIKHGMLYHNGVDVNVRTSSNPNDDEIYLKYKKVKFFLCSRDIQVGDKLQIQQYNGDPNWCATFNKEDFEGHFVCNFIDVHDNSEFGVLAKDAIKVIGEISPDATWVKEGDEFDEDEWIGWNNMYNQSHDKKFHEGVLYKDIRIKGPCGHFH